MIAEEAADTGGAALDSNIHCALTLNSMIAELDIASYCEAFAAARVHDEELMAACRAGAEAVEALIKSVGLRGGSATKVRRHLLRAGNPAEACTREAAKPHGKRTRIKEAASDSQAASQQPEELVQRNGQFVVTSEADLQRMFDNAQRCMIASGIVVLEFKAGWCIGCKKFAPTFARLVEELPSTYLCVTDVDEAPELSQAYDVNQLPHFVIFKDGKRWDALTGGKATILRQKVLYAIDGRKYNA
mmetsp:Transcript_46827/g.132102  ORF Transcript_46827/g.132102 Transcript_46827/m.132102 type:complete len:245 (+) Transcript_46827:152-886(+)